MQVTEILEKIRTTKGSIAKSDILREHRENDLLKRVLKVSQFADDLEAEIKMGDLVRKEGDTRTRGVSQNGSCSVMC